jgi:hypothetical protein
MVNNRFKILFVFLLCVSALIPVSGFVSAQGNSSRSTDSLYQATGDLITFAQLEQEEITLTGPYDGISILFGLPADWELSEGGEIELSLGVSFNSAVSTTAEVPVISGGLMTVQFNSVTVDILSLTQVGDGTYTLSIPASALESRRDDGRMELSLLLDAGFSCDFDQQMLVIIHPTSYINLPHQSVAPDTNLVNFPSPIYQDSVFLDSALIIVPDEPTSAELQSVISVSAGFGNIAKNNLALDLVTASGVTAEQLANNHLILIGKAETLPLRDELDLPLPVGDGGFQVVDGGQDDGVIELVNSTWSTSHVVLVVSGNTDAGVVKAAQALSTGVLRPNRLPNLAIIDAVQSRPLPSSQPVDQTLADLGYETELIEGRGLSILSYDFYIPPGWNVANDAYFQLAFAHSALLNFDRSGLVVSLNGSPIGSAQLTDLTASNTKNQITIDLPASEVVSGINTLDIEADLLPIDNCATPNLQGLWATIWSDSVLHLPLILAPVDPVSTFDLSTFPSPFTFDPSLSDAAFVLPHNDPDAWHSAIRIAQYLGDQGNPPVVTLKTFYGDELTEDERANYNLLIVGRATQLPVIGEINENLPAPFIENSDIAQENNMQVTFRFPPETPLGYLQLLTSPWNSERVVLAALGNTAQGVKWSGSALIDAPMRSQIAGNFAVINNQQVVTTDTRLPTLSQQPPVAEDTSGVAAPEIEPQSSQSTYEKPGWILIALGVSAGLAVIVLLVAILTSWSRNRSRVPKESDE